MQDNSAELNRRRRPAARRYKSLRAVLALMLREMETTYGRSVIGYAWAVMEPIAAISILTLVMSLAFASPPIGKSFALFYATGYLPFMMYTDIASKISVSLKYSKPLLTYPSVTFLDALIARFALNFLTHLLVFVIFMATILIALNINTALNYAHIFNALAMAAALGLGIGTLNCVAISIFPFWERVWAILNRPLFIVSAILFMYDDVPGTVRDILWYNPLIHFIGEMRKGFYPTYDGPYVSSGYVFILSMTCFAFGILFLRRFYRKILREN